MLVRISPALVSAASLLVFALAAPLLFAEEEPASETTQTESAIPPMPAQPAMPGESTDEFKLIPDEINLVPMPPSSEPAASSAKLRLAPPVYIEPILPPLNLAPLPSPSLSTSARVFVKRFHFAGNHVFSSRELSKVVGKYEGREITSEELEQARQDLTVLYVNHGYINSGAVLEDQDIAGGEITFHIIEGQLTQINLTGNHWFLGYWLRHEMRRAAGRPLNFNRLKEGLQLLRQNPTISRVNGELKPGGKPGESMLDAQVKDEQPFRLGIEFSNKRPPSVGAEILEVHAADLNLTGHNDPLEIQWGVTHTTGEQISDGWEFTGADNLAGSYAAPFTPWDTTLQVHGSRSDSSIVEETFAALNINSKSERYGATIRQPVIERLNDDLALSVTLDRGHSETFLLDRPFSLSPGEVNGVQDVTVLRAAIEAVNRSQVHVLALRSTFNLGLEAFGSTHDNGSTRDSDFFSWLGQAQYVRRMFNTDNLCLIRVNAQLANDKLLSLEQFSLGGAASVRGYRENQLLRDNGLFASLEFHVPVLYGKTKAPIVSLAPFFDIGTGWNAVRIPRGNSAGGTAAANGQQQSRSKQRELETIYSAGIGLIFNPTKYISGQIYWGYAFNRDVIVKNGDNLQDYGLHFSLSVNAF